MLRRIRLPHWIYACIPFTFVLCGMLIISSSVNWLDTKPYLTTNEWIMVVIGLCSFFWGCFLRAERSYYRKKFKDRKDTWL